MAAHNDPSLHQPTFLTPPKGWRIERLYDVAELRLSNVDKKTVEDERAVLLCNYVDVYKNDRITSELSFMEATAPDAQIERFTLVKGDVIITKDSESPDDIGVPAYVAETVPNLVCGYHLTILRPDVNVITGPYLFYALEGRVSAYQFYLASNGVTRYALTYQGTKNIQVAFPSIEEQRQIAAFLDWKTGQIDALVAKKELLLERLKEKRMAVITRAVTKGLKPDVPLRESTIEWLGKVPTHWEVMRFAYRTHIQQGQVDPEDDDYADLPMIAPNHIESGTGRVTGVTSARDQAAISGKYLVRNGDIVYSKIRPHLNKCAMADFDGLCSADMYPIRTELDLHAEFLLYWILARPFLDYATLSSMRVAMPKLNRETLGSAPLVVPPEKEQLEIVEHIRKVTGRIDRLMRKVEGALERLVEYRSALITSATTGKIDLRKVKVPRTMS